VAFYFLDGFCCVRWRIFFFLVYFTHRHLIPLAKKPPGELNEVIKHPARTRAVLNPSTDIEIYNIVKQRFGWR
jgi:hypothetical protein